MPKHIRSESWRDAAARKAWKSEADREHDLRAAAAYEHAAFYTTFAAGCDYWREKFQAPFDGFFASDDLE